MIIIKIKFISLANAVVVKDIPSNSLVVGIPGKVIKTGIRKSDND